MQLSATRIIHIATLLLLYMETSLLASEMNCTCEYYETYDWIGPYCHNWAQDGSIFCLLSGGGNASSCTDAV